MSAQNFICGQNGRGDKQLMSGEEADRLSKATSKALLGAIEQELHSIISKGVSISTLLELSRFSHTAQELLMIRSPLAEVRRKKHGIGMALGQMGVGMVANYNQGLGAYGGPGGVAMSPYQNEYGYDEDDADVDSLTGEAAQNETFGAKMTREIISALGALKRSSGPSVPDLIESIKQAKEANLDSVVTRLEISLDEALGGSGSPAPEPEAATPSNGRPTYPVPGIPMDVASLGADAPPPSQLTSAPAPETAQVTQ